MSTRVVCLHGLRRTPADWAGVRAGLPEACSVTIPALPADPAAALAVADRAISAGDIVFAHSMGAVVALRLLQSEHRQLGALVLTGAFFPPARNGRSLPASVGDYARHRVALVRSRGDSSAARSERSAKALGSLLLATARSRTVEPMVTAPVLVVHARDDHHVPVDFAIAAAHRHPGWDLSVIPSGGHHVHVDHPQRWLAHVAPWLHDRVTGGSAPPPA